MMLARVGESLYWLGRYLERAENVARLATVTTELAAELEGLDDAMAQGVWDTVFEALPGTGVAPHEYSAESGGAIPFLHSLVFDPTNPISVTSSLGHARENARAVREALTVEVFLQLNAARRDLGRRPRSRLTDPAVALDAARTAHAQLLTIVGAMDHTLSRDEGWTFLKLGESIERVQRTLLVLRATLPDLTKQDAELPLVYARWRALLRSLASLECFRREQGAGIDPKGVVGFILFAPSAPRSLRCGLERMKIYLDRLPAATEFTAPERIAGGLLASVQYDDQSIRRESDPIPFLDRALTALGGVHEALDEQYFKV